MHNPTSQLRLGALALLWGSSFLFIKVGLEALSPPQLTLARIVLGAVVLIAICKLRGDRVGGDRGLWQQVTVAALFASALPWLLYGIAEQSVDSGLTGVLNATTPLWTVLFGLVAGRESRVSPLRAVGLAFGFLGVVLILAPWHSDGLLHWGVLAALTAAASYGIGYVYIGAKLTGDRIREHGVTPLALAAMQMIAATGLALIAIPAGGLQAVRLDPLPLLAVAVLGIFGTGVGFALNYRLIADEGPTTASTVTYLMPIVSVLLGAVLLDEEIGPNVVLGMVVVLIGVALSRNRPAKRSALFPTSRAYAELARNHPLK